MAGTNETAAFKSHYLSRDVINLEQQDCIYKRIHLDLNDAGMKARYLMAPMGRPEIGRRDEGITPGQGQQILVARNHGISIVPIMMVIMVCGYSPSTLATSRT